MAPIRHAHAMSKQLPQLALADFGPLFEATPAAIALSRLSDGVFVAANDAFLRMHGYARDEILGHTSTELGLWHRPEMREPIVAALRQNGRVHNFIGEYRSKSGRTGRNAASIVVVDIGGEPHMLGILTDLAELDRARDDLTSKENLLDYVQRAAGIGVWEWDSASGCARWTPQMEMLAGLMPGSFGGRYEDFKALVHPDDIGEVERKWFAAMAAEMPFELEHRIVRPADGAVRWIGVKGATVSRRDDGIQRVVGIWMDITESKQAEAALRESQGLYQGIFDAESDAILVVTADASRIIDANAAAMQLYGYSREEFLTLGVEDISTQPEESRQAIAQHRSRVPLRWHRRKDGTVFPVEISGTYFEANGRKLHIASIRDSTERRRMEDALRQANADLEQRVAERTRQLRELSVEATLAEERERRAIAHDLHDDLGQLLYAAKVKADMLARSALDAAAAARLEELQRLLDEASVRVRTLTAQLSPPVLERLGLIPALEWLAEDLDQSFGLTVEVEDDGRPKPLATAQAAILFRAVRELLINVVKHSRSMYAHIRSASDDGTLVLQVTDEGAGLANTDAAFAGRSGFGLVSLRERIGHLGGTVAVESSPDAGTQVTIRLPFEKPFGQEGNA